MSDSILNEPHKSKLRHGGIFGAISLLILALLVYGRSLNNELTNWDDSVYLGLRDLARFNFLDLIQGTVFGQFFPVTLTSIAIDNAMCGTQGLCYHITSLIFHYLSAVMVLQLARQIFKLPDLMAFLTAALFLSHPLDVEAVSWLAARNHVLAGFFQLAALLLYSKYLDRLHPSQSRSRKNLYFSGVIILFLLALLSKVTSGCLIALFVFLDFYRQRRDWPRLLTEKILLTVPFIILLVHSTKSMDQGPLQTVFHLSFWERGLWVLKGIVFYLGRLFIPHRLTAYYDIHSFEFDALDIFGFIVAISILVIFPLILKPKKWLLWFGIFSFFCYYAPISKIIPFGDDSIFNDRYMYPIVAFCSCSLVFFIHEFFGAWKKLRLTVLVTAVATTSALTFEQTQVWYNSISLWQDVIDKYPKTILAYNNLASTYVLSGQFEQAIPHLTKSIELQPDYALPYYNFALINMWQNHTDDAIRYFKKSIELKPYYPEAYTNLGVLYMDKKQDYLQALENVQKAIDQGSTYPQSFNNLGQILLRLGRLEESAVAFQRALAMDNQFAQPFLGLAQIATLQKNIPAALENLAMAEKLDPTLRDSVELIRKSLPTQ